MEEGITDAVVTAVPAVVDLLLAALLIGVVVYGVTEIVKIPYHKHCKKKGKEHATWWRIFIRIVPMGLGALLGSFFFVFPWGISVGGGAGLLCTLLYKKTRKLISSFRDGDLTDS